MTLKPYLWAIRVITFFALSVLVYIISFVDPDIAGISGKIAFYFTILLSLSGMLSLFLYRIRRSSIESGEVNIWLEIRQGFLLALLFIGLLFFQELGILLWWDGLLLAAGVLLIELYFLSDRE